MSGVLPIVSVDRHLEITWNPLGWRAVVADLQCGERNKRSLGLRLTGIAFAEMLICALKRAVQTCELAGFGDQIDHDLVQWDYGRWARQDIEIANWRKTIPNHSRTA